MSLRITQSKAQWCRTGEAFTVFLGLGVSSNVKILPYYFFSQMFEIIIKKTIACIVLMQSKMHSK